MDPFLLPRLFWRALPSGTLGTVLPSALKFVQIRRFSVRKAALNRLCHEKQRNTESDGSSLVGPSIRGQERCRLRQDKLTLARDAVLHVRSFRFPRGPAFAMRNDVQNMSAFSGARPLARCGEMNSDRGQGGKGHSSTMAGSGKSCSDLE